MILPLLVTHAIPSDQAIARAKQVLRDFDIKGPYRLQSLGGPYENGDRSRWHLKLSADSFTYEVAITDAGRVRYVERSDFGGARTEEKDPSVLKRTARWLKKLKPPMPVRPIPSGSFGGSSAYFQGLVGGYPVVYPRTALGYHFMLVNGKLFSFSADEEPPSIVPTSPKLTETQALQAVDRIFRNEFPPKNGSTFSYRLYDKRELGWAIPEKGMVPRLVWRVPFFLNSTNAFGSRGGSNGMLIDAITGERIKTPTII